MSANKTLYREFARLEKQLPVFLQPWWLDAVCGDTQWEVSLSVDSEGRIRGALPYHIRYWKRLFKVILPPVLTPFSGIWIAPGIEGTAYYRENSRIKDILTDLIRQLPQVDYFIQNYHYSLTNWLPFYWAGYHQTTRYTHVLDITPAPEELLSQCKGSIRTDIRNGDRQFQYTRVEDCRVFCDIQRAMYASKRMKMPYSNSLIERIDKALCANGRRVILHAVDDSGGVHAVVYLIIDGPTAYYWAGGAEPRWRKSNALTPLIWHAIGVSRTEGCIRYDFEGSMIPEVERVFRAFGAVQLPYFTVFKGRNKLFDAIGILLRK